MRKRCLKVLCTAVILLCAGLFYAFLVRRTGVGVPCVFRLLTGWKCPGCGVTRMAVSLLHGDVREAYMHNRAVSLLLPAFVFVAAAWCVGYIRTGARVLRGAPKWTAWGILAVLLVFGVARNFLGW